MTQGSPLLRIEDLQSQFWSDTGVVRAVDHVGENLAVGDVVHVLKDDIAEAHAQGISQAPRPAVAIGSAITDEDSGHDAWSPPSCPILRPPHASRKVL